MLFYLTLHRINSRALDICNNLPNLYNSPENFDNLQMITMGGTYYSSWNFNEVTSMRLQHTIVYKVAPVERLQALI